MEIDDRPGTEPGAERVAAARADGDADGEARRVRITDPEAWHDLAERGTPRNG